MTSPSLGRGLSALLGDSLDPQDVERMGHDLIYLDSDRLHPGKMQPRKHFDQESLNSLAQSIQQKGILQPLLVRWIDSTHESAEIIAGERRWRAAHIAGIHSIPAIVVDYNDQECLEVGLVENLQRDDLNPIEEAESLKKLIDEYNRTQEEVATAIGKSRSHVANALRLLALPESVKDQVRRGELSAGHARTLINNPEAETLAKRIVDEKMSVREAENWQKKQHAEADRNPDAVFLEQEIERITGMQTKLKTRPSGSGEVRLMFDSMSQLDWLVRKISS